MASTVDIANIALSSLGEAAISALTEANPRARACDRHYELARDAVLRELKIPATIQRKALVQLADAPVNGYTYAYQLPTDCLYVIETVPKGAYPYTIEGSALLSDESTAEIKYIQRVSDPNAFDALTLNAIAMRLAWHIADPLTGSLNRKDQAWRDYQSALAAARGAGHSEAGMENQDAQFSWVSARTR